MLQKTRAIALHTIKYGDSGIVAYVYTEQFGRQTYLIKNVQGKKAPIKSNLFHPLCLLEIEVYYNQVKDLQKLKEVNNFPVIQRIYSEPAKHAIALFLAEVIYRAIKEEISNSSLFQFIFNSVLLLDNEEMAYSEFHLVFLMQMLKYIGFSPLNNYQNEKSIFDLQSGQFINEMPRYGQYIPPECSFHFSTLISSNFNDIAKIKFSRETRQILLEKIIEYYRLHVDGIGQIKSLAILKEVFR
jgi:DNA repair protein RecO (recombination protein O)